MIPRPSLKTQTVNFLARPLVRNVLKIMSGNVAGNALNFIALWLIGRLLGPEKNGQLYPMMLVMALLAQLTDMGLNTTIIKYYRELANQERHESAEALMRRAWWIRMGAAAIAAGACIILARPICTLWLKQPELAGLFRIACLGGLGSAAWMFCQGAMQAREQFGLYARLTFGNHGLRLLLLGLLIWIMPQLKLPTVMLLLAAVPYMGALQASLRWPKRFWKSRLPSDQMREHQRKIIAFSKWIFISSITCSLILQMEGVLLSWLASSQEVGLYSMAIRIAFGLLLIATALSTVLLPKMASTRQRSEIVRFHSYLRRSMPLIGLLALGTMGAAHLLSPWILGEEYANSIWLLDMLFGAYSVAIINNVFSLFCLAFDRAHWLTWMNLVQLGLCFIPGYYLIARWGAAGAALNALVLQVFALLYLSALYPKVLKMADAHDKALQQDSQKA